MWGVVLGRGVARAYQGCWGRALQAMRVAGRGAGQYKGSAVEWGCTA
jgi:hypothetical protein